MATEIKRTPLGLDYVKQFTEAYLVSGDTLDLYQREIRCEAVQIPLTLVPPGPEDLLAGKRIFPEVGYSLQYGGLGYYADFSVWGDVLHPETCSEAERREWVELRQFWEKENTSRLAYQALSAEARKRCPETFMTAPRLDWPAYPIPRVAGLQLNFSKLVQSGIQGLRQEVDYASSKFPEPQVKAYFAASLASLDRLESTIQFHQDAAIKHKTPASLKLADVLSALFEGPPQHFHEALQLVQLVAQATTTNNYGRLDVTLGTLLSRDLESGHITWEEALELMQHFYRMLESEFFHTDARIIVGGMGRPNERDADRFALLAMETTDSLNLPLPQLTLRFYKGQNPVLLDKAYDVVGRGKTFPMLYNDDVLVPAVEKAYQVNRRTAEQGIPFGCGEYMIHHQSLGSPNAILNLQRCLESAINHGCCLTTNQQIGPDFGGLETFGNFEDLWRAYTQTVDYFMEPLAEGQESFYQTAGRCCPFSLASLLYDDCLDRGKPLCAGGARYVGGSNETYGNVDTADSLTAVKQVFFEEGQFSAQEILTALKANWSGHEKMLRVFKAAPKFGNDDDVADSMMTRVHEHVCQATIRAGQKTGLHHFLVVVINNNTNTTWGLHTGPSFNGRFHGDPLAPGNAPGAGCDQSGLTAVLNSQAKPDPGIHAGSVQNVRLSANFPANHPDLYRSLLNTYFEIGGSQSMITVTNREDLLAALEQYANLLVRVGGFSARFIDLDSDTQKEILSRTEHG